MPAIDQDYSENVIISGDFARLNVAAIDTAADYVQFLDATDGATKRCLASALGGGGGGGTVYAGSTTINFGAFPGTSDATATVTGQTGIVSGSVLQAWLVAQATADHTADEHRVETIAVTCGNIVANTSFDIYATNTSQLNEPLTDARMDSFRSTAATTYGNAGRSVGGQGTRIYGTWTVHWRWS